jgi:polyisoprenoid-binding protein YceI
MREMLGGTQEVASFEASTAVERGNFGVGVGSWATTMVVGGEVEIEIVAEAQRR